MTSPRRHLDDGAPRVALERLDEAPEPAERACVEARALAQLDRFEEALAVAAAAAERHPGRAELAHIQGALLTALGNPRDARRALRRALRRAPEDAIAEHLLRAAGGRGFETPHAHEVEELFDTHAEHFDAHIQALGYQGHQLLPERLADELDGRVAHRALDLGCGTGLCGPGLRPLTRRLIGVDLSRNMVQETRARGLYDHAFAADLVFALGGLSPDSVELLVSADVFGYLGPLDAPLACAARVLRPGGLLAFSVEALERGPGELQLRPSRRFAYTRRYLERALTQAGLRPIHLEGRSLRREAGQTLGHHIALARLEG